MKNKIFSSVIGILFVAATGIMLVDKTNSGNISYAEMVTKSINSGSTSAYNTNNNANNTQETGDYINVKVNQPVALSYKSKEYVFQIRKDFVSKSPFANPNYEPSNEVFGQIESNKPWKNLTQCLLDDDRTGIDGPSEESRFINNPTALVQLDGGWCNPCSSDKAKTASSTRLLIPKSIRYSKSKNEVEVTYREIVDEGATYDFKGINARDFGYKYVYMDPQKSTFKPKFTSPSNISNRVHEYRDFIHCGGSCKWQGGCNNASPYQPEIEFTYRSNGEKKQKNDVVYLKLWKQRPASPNGAADIYEKIVIEYN